MNVLNYQVTRFARDNNIIWDVLKSTDAPSVLEPEGLNQGDEKRPDGITIFPFSQGKALCLDATSRATMCLET